MVRIVNIKAPLALVMYVRLLLILDFQIQIRRLKVEHIDLFPLYFSIFSSLGPLLLFCNLVLRAVIDWFVVT